METKSWLVIHHIIQIKKAAYRQLFLFVVFKFLLNDQREFAVFAFSLFDPVSLLIVLVYIVFLLGYGTISFVDNVLSFITFLIIGRGYLF